MSYIYDLTDTWNAAGTTFNAIKMNVTNTASAAGSRLITCQISGVEKFSVDKDGVGYFSGNVGIGTSSPAYKLDVVSGDTTSGYTARLRANATAGYSRLQFTDSGATAQWAALSANSSTLYVGADGGTLIVQTSGSERLRIDSSGKVGIATSAPVAPLSIVQAGASYGSQATYSGTIQIAAGPAGLQASGGLEFLTSTYSNGYGWKMSSIDSSGVHLVFGNRSDSATWTERLRINSSGNVGIGTTGLTSTRLGVSVADGSYQLGLAGTSKGLRLRSDTGDFKIEATDQTLTSSFQPLWLAGSNLQFAINATERMRIDSSGNVGIGTSSPTSRLTITGGVTEIRDGNYLMLRPSGNAWDMRLQATGTQLDILSGGALGSPIMSLVNGGNVGIGTSSPTQRLHVRQDQNGTTAALIQNRNATGSPVAAVQFISGGFDLSDNRYAMIASDGGSNTTLQFWTGQGATPTEKMRIGSSGLVGINTTSTPTYGPAKLVVDGNISGKGTVTVNNSTATTIAEGAGMLLLIRNTTHGGTAVVQYENAQTPIIIATSGGTTFQTGTPSGSAQIQLTSKSGNLGVAALASSDRNGAVLAVTVLQTFG